MADSTVAVLGTGIMGFPMARSLLEAGVNVRAWNRSREKAEPLAEYGATVADSPTEAAAGAEVLLTMLADAETVEENVGEEGGPLEALSGERLWLQMSTVGIEGSQRLGNRAARHGVTYVDAPVLGTKEPAEQGQLVVLASGPEEARESCAPVFDAVGSKTVWLGPAGAGSRLKLVVNNWITGLLGTLAETIALARATGVDPERFLETIEGGPLGLPYAQLKGKMMISGEYPTSFSARLARKDVGLVLDAAEAQDLELSIAEAVAARFEDAIDAGYGEEDMAAIYRGVARNHG